MTWKIHRKTRTRFEEPGHARFLTFSCRHRRPLFNRPDIRDLFANQLLNARVRLGFKLYAWVVMPEHIHLLVRTGSADLTVPKILMAVKRPVSARALKILRENGEQVPDTFWQPGGGHDRNVYSQEEFAEKTNYIHANPVQRGLVSRPSDWAWSSWHALHGQETRWGNIDRQ